MAGRGSSHLVTSTALTLLLALLTLAVAAPSEAGSTVLIVNLDGPGEGLNDPAPFDPVGGNPATTLGEARLAAVRFAASVWAGVLDSPIPIELGVSFDPLGGTSSAATLGFGGAQAVYRDFLGAPLPATWYPGALADALGAYDLAEGSAVDLTVVFNRDVDGDQVLGTSRFYYGFDGNAPPEDADLVEVALHEIAHGLGFNTVLDRTTGARLFGYDDAYLVHLERHGAVPPDFPSMTDAQRLAATTAEPEVHWTGPRAVAAAAALTAGTGTGGHLILHAPSPASPANSLTHLSAAVTPEELLEPAYSPATIPDPSLTAAVLADVGWPPPGVCQTGVPIGPGGPPPQTIAESGVISILTPNRATWETVALAHTFSDPVVIAQPVSYKGGQQALARVRNVTPTGFEIQVGEWDYMDGYHTTDLFNHRIRSRRPAAAAAGMVVLGQESRIPSEDGSVIYVFDEAGRHLRTEDADTGQTLMSFGYQSFDDRLLLTTVTDAFANVTTIERGAAGEPQAIRGPFGHRTVLGLYPDGYLSSATNPASEQVLLTYHPDGLLASLTDPGAHRTSFDYSPLGRLSLDTDNAGGFTDLDRTDSENGSLVSKTSALGRTTTYRTDELTDGTQHLTVTAPDGSITESWIRPNGSRSVAHSDGSSVDLHQSPDLRHGMITPQLSSTIFTTAQGLVQTLTSQQAVAGADPVTGEAVGLTTTLTRNGKATVIVRDLAARTLTTTSPEGRVGTVEFDPFGRVTRRQAGGLQPIGYGYETRGRLETVTQGPRALTYVYYPDSGFLEKVIDPLDREVRFTYDAVGRVETQTLPDSRVIAYDYDADGNLVSITPPGRPQHEFDHTVVELPWTYTAPEVGSEPRTTTLDWNLDRQLELVTRPDLQTIDYVYEPASGRLQSIVVPNGVYTYSYDPTTGIVTSVTDPDGGTLTYGYDGALPLSATWAGEVSGSVSQVYDADFRVGQRLVNGADPVDFSYDVDGLLTAAGQLTLVHDPVSGLLSDTTLGALTDDRVPNEFGELETYTASHGGAAIYSFDLVRDDLGRITDETETVEGVTSAYRYTYDDAGRLTDVERDGAPWTHYDYDPNSNRIGWTDPWSSGTQADTLYDERDRLLAYGDTTYTYTANGELRTRTQNGQTLTYDYDVFGNLRGATLPDGIRIDYVLDAAHRRVGKKVDGTLVRGFLYADQLAPVAELDGAGGVVRRFVYASQRHVPDYMVQGGVTYRLLTDHLGSVRLVVDAASGAVAQRLDYDPFGRILLDTNPGFQPFGFAGGLTDPHTDLVHFGAREYDPQTGRWTAQDPIGFAGGDTNLYGYVLNDPINAIDPSGLVADVVVDAGLVGYDVYALIRDLVSDCPQATLGENLLALGADLVGAAIPFATGLGAAARGALRYGDDAVDAAKVARRANTGGREATGVLGSRRAPLSNAPYQPLQNADAVIGGRTFSGHALDQMRNRGLTPSVVENTVQTGVSSADPIPGRVRFYDPVNDVSVILEGERVVTARPGGF